jgi:flagellar biosynthetic protein FliR
MINFTDAQLQLWLASLIWPLARILGLIMSAPFISETGIPVPARILLGTVITLAIAPTIGPLPSVAVGSWEGIGVLVREILIGVSLGILMQTLFAAVSLAGELVGTQMGLGFATLYDPNSESSTTSFSALMVALSGLVFFAIDGHLAMFGALAQTFKTLPIAELGFKASGLKMLTAYGGVLCMHGLVMALPITITLIIVNLSLGMLSKAAPQLNLFSIGFPITLAAGLFLAFIGLPGWLRAFDKLWEVSLDGITRAAGAL